MKKYFIIALLAVSGATLQALGHGPDKESATKLESVVSNSSPEQAAIELPGQENVISDYPEGAEAWASKGDDSKQQLTRQQVKAQELQEKDSFGGAVTLMSMVIVVLCLAILAILFMCFGSISSYFQKKRKIETQGKKEITNAPEADSGEAIAAIAAALAEHFSGKHDIEDTVLTIKRMKRAYSPWNSKIYNLRVTPTRVRNK